VRSKPALTPGMSAVYWEKQGADRLCAVHCLNALLQGPYFTPADLADIAHQLDRQEALLMGGAALAGEKSSANVDDDGNFSSQVLDEALKRHNCNSTNSLHESVRAQISQSPEREVGYICNLHAHWFALRKVNWGGKLEWFNLNSLEMGGPELVSEFKLAAFLESIRQQNYTIFVVRGQYPASDPAIFSGSLLEHQMYVDAAKMQILQQQKKEKEAKDMQQAINASKEGGEDAPPSFSMFAPADKRAAPATDWNALGGGNRLDGGGASTAAPAADDDMDDDLRAALAASMQDVQKSLPEPIAEPDAAAPDTCTIQVRTSGKAHKRRFPMECPIVKVFEWLEFVSASDPGSLGLSTPLIAHGTYHIMTQTFPPAARKKYSRTGQQVEEGGKPVGDSTLKALGFEKQEGLILQA